MSVTAKPIGSFLLPFSLVVINQQAVENFLQRLIITKVDQIKHFPDASEITAEAPGIFDLIVFSPDDKPVIPAYNLSITLDGEVVATRVHTPEEESLRYGMLETEKGI